MGEIELQGNRWTLVKKIGQGCTSQVYKAANKKGQTLCIKIISNAFYKSSAGKELIDNQIKILQKISHENILAFHRTERKEKVMIMTELCEEGTLYDYLRKKKKIEERECSQIMRQIIEGCRYLHEKGIVHRDLKPQNIFRKNKKIKIADFGFAAQSTNVKLMSLNVGSPLYMPYEALAQKKFSIQSDIFAIGVIWYELLTGNTPFIAGTEAQLKAKTKNNQFRTKQIKSVNKKTEKLIYRCLNKNIADRPKLKDLLEAIKESHETHRPRAQSSIITVSTNIPKQIKISIKQMKVEQKQQIKSSKGQNKQNRPVAQGNRQNRSITTCSIKENKYKYQKYQPKIVEANNKQKVKQDPILVKIKQSIELKPIIQVPEDFTVLLGRLAQLNLGFLPYSIQAKFTLIINKYQSLLFTAKNQLLSARQGQRHSQFQDDELIAQIARCQTQSSFCRCLHDFLRRLMRIAKSYKQWSGRLKDLNVLWERVESFCKMETPSS